MVNTYTMQEFIKYTSVKYISSYITIQKHVSVASATIFKVSHKITQCTNNNINTIKTTPYYRLS